MRPPVIASSAADVNSGVCRATPVSRRAASSTSAAVGNATGSSTALMTGNGSAAVASQARPFGAATLWCYAMRLVKPAGGVGQHGVHLAGVGSQVVAGHSRTAIAPRNIVEEPFEFVNVVLNGLAKLRIGPIFVAYFLKCPLS